MTLEYLVIRVRWDSPKKLTDTVNTYAADGWRLTTFSALSDELVFVFERPKQV